jgi:hypothetical protein
MVAKLSTATQSTCDRLLLLLLLSNAARNPCIIAVSPEQLVCAYEIHEKIAASVQHLARACACAEIMSDFCHSCRYIADVDGAGELTDKSQLIVIRTSLLHTCQRPQYASTVFCAKLPECVDHLAGEEPEWRCWRTSTR